jgi:hypothetical protein
LLQQAPEWGRTGTTVSSCTRSARYTPDTAVVGTIHDADTAQLPQSMSRSGRPVDFGEALRMALIRRRPCGRRFLGSNPSEGSRCGSSSPEY